MTSPDGASRLLPGTYTEALFSADGSKLYAVFSGTNGSGGTVTVLDVATGAALATYRVGQYLGGADLSPDGSTLLIADQGSSGGGHFFALDVATGAVTSFADPSASSVHDVSFLTNTTALVATVGGALQKYDLATGSVTVLANGNHPTLSPSADHGQVLVEWDLGSTNSSSAVYRSDGSLVASGAGDSNTVFSHDYQAVGADGHTLFDTRGNLVFSTDLTTGTTVGAYALNAPPISYDGFGTNYDFSNLIKASPDGHTLSVIEAGGIELLDLTKAAYAIGPGDDVLTGTVLYGLGGNDTLIDPAPEARPGGISGDLYGGTGDDSYYVNANSTRIHEEPGQGTDTVYSGAGGFYMPANVENLVLTGTGGGGVIGYGGYGNELDNVITGSVVNDSLWGWLGNDTLIGNAGNDDLRGDDGNDLLDGGAGNDSLQGGTGDDVILGGGGNNVVDGGDGTDTLVLTGARASYTVLTAGGYTYLVGPDGADRVVNAEQVRFNDATVSFADAVAGAQPFDALRYIASYPDLVRAFGTDAAAGAQHYIDHGFAEGRTAFAAGFDGREYLASNPDLARTFGDNASFGVWHYLTYGFTEGRPTATFDAREYLASNPDLAAIFGNDPAAGTTHYLHYGATEGRPTASFDPQQYLAANTDVLRAFGNDAAAATAHYLNYGADEGRATGGFDAVGYLLSNPDLQAAGFGASGAFNHWLVYGAAEGRAGDAAFGREQTDHALTPGTAASQAIDTAGDHDWFQLDLSAGQHAHLDVTAAFGETVTVHDAAGHLLASATATDGHLGLDVTAAAAGSYYVTVEAMDASVHGAYAIAATVG